MTACAHPLDITFSIADDGKSITFKPCGFTSHHPLDIEGRYCARCHRFMDLIDLAREMNRPDYWPKRRAKT